ncbi:hypothetical protein T492DRAFT_859479, partial [Pavlovales sp. CCMP2436]
MSEVEGEPTGKEGEPAPLVEGELAAREEEAEPSAPEVEGEPTAGEQPAAISDGPVDAEPAEAEAAAAAAEAVTEVAEAVAAAAVEGEAEEAAEPEPDHSGSDPGEPGEPTPEQRAAAMGARARALKVGLPRLPTMPGLATVEYLVFQSWWVEKGTKRVVEIALELATERFRVTLDKEVHFLSPDMQFSSSTESFLPTVRKDTKVLECHLHEKFSDNQHALSLELPHLQ